MKAYWLPPGFSGSVAEEITTVTRGGRAVDVAFPLFEPELVTRLATHLRSARRALAERPVAAIAEVLDAASEAWLGPERDPIVPAISVVTGFSEAMVRRAIDLEMVSSRAPDMLGALDRELGDHRALDGFVPTAMGAARAFGPELIGGVFSANIPALPHLTVMRAFLVKAACLGRVSRGEPLFLAAYARTVARLDPALGECLGVLWWPADDRRNEAAFLGSIDHLVAYGGDRTLDEIATRCPPRLPATWHGHRMGFALVQRGAPREGLAERLAFDFSLFDQHACLAPQAVFVEGGWDEAVALADSLERALAALRLELPPRELQPAEAARLRAAHEGWAVRECLGERVRLCGDLQGSVVVDGALLSPASPGPGDGLIPGALDRSVRVVPVPSFEHLAPLLAPLRGVLQCCALARGPSDPDLRAQLGALGVTRVCPPGLMGTPSMRWAHDGLGCLARLVRWCDEETVAPGETREA